MLFESIEIRKVRNGVIVTLRTDEDEDQEYVYDSDRKAIKFVKDLLETKNKEQAPAWYKLWSLKKNTTLVIPFGYMALQ